MPKWHMSRLQCLRVYVVTWAIQRKSSRKRLWPAHVTLDRCLGLTDHLYPNCHAEDSQFRVCSSFRARVSGPVHFNIYGKVENQDVTIMHLEGDDMHVEDFDFVSYWEDWIWVVLSKCSCPRLHHCTSLWRLMCILWEVFWVWQGTVILEYKWLAPYFDSCQENYFVTESGRELLHTELSSKRKKSTLRKMVYELKKGKVPSLRDCHPPRAFYLSRLADTPTIFLADYNVNDWQ